MFRGTIDGAAVYPREVVKRALYHNAADIAITRILKTAMQTIEVRVLDHLVIGAGEVISFAERGLL